jgi:hypothetical protein
MRGPGKSPAGSSGGDGTPGTATELLMAGADLWQVLERMVRRRADLSLNQFNVLRVLSGREPDSAHASDLTRTLGMSLRPCDDGAAAAGATRAHRAAREPQQPAPARRADELRGPRPSIGRVPLRAGGGSFARNPPASSDPTSRQSRQIRTPAVEPRLNTRRKTGVNGIGRLLAESGPVRVLFDSRHPSSPLPAPLRSQGSQVRILPGVLTSSLKQTLSETSRGPSGTQAGARTSSTGMRASAHQSGGSGRAGV